jgi:predicted ArsR family transcriptional regulator
VENRPRRDQIRGPRPTGRRAALSPQRAAFLRRLVDQPEPVTLAALVAVSGLHENTVREHLNGLVRGGWARREPAPRSGRGRPAWLYEAVEGDGNGEYAALAAALAGSIARSSAQPVADAGIAGELWGRELMRRRASEPPTPEEARDNVVALFDDLGFDPEVDAAERSVVRLRCCPLLEAAYREPEVVCGVHLGIVRGALEEQGAPTHGLELAPFAEPGACLLTVPPRP